MGELFVSLLWLAISLAIGGVLGDKLKGQQKTGTLLGLLGPIGWICVILLTDKRPKCPACLKAVIPGATKCSGCGSDLPKPAATQPGVDPDYRSAKLVEDRESWKKALGLLVIIALAIVAMVFLVAKFS